MSYIQYSTEENLSDSWRLLYISQTTYGNDWISMLHTHSFSEIFYITDGSGFLCTENEQIPLHKDMLVQINPNIRHTEKSSDKHPLSYIALGIDDLLFDFPDHSGQDSEDTALSQNGCQITRLHSDQADILPLLKMILAEAHRHEPASEQICQYLLNAFLLKIGRVTNSQFSAGSVPDISGECAQIKDYIDHHYSEEVTLDDLAALSHLNKYYLSHIFSKSYGVAPINYLLERRILNSKELLKNTDYSITHIAHMTGFSSANYFSQSLKKHTGITAAAYRKNFKKKL